MLKERFQEIKEKLLREIRSFYGDRLVSVVFLVLLPGRLNVSIPISIY